MVQAVSYLDQGMVETILTPTLSNHRPERNFTQDTLDAWEVKVIDINEYIY